MTPASSIIIAIICAILGGFAQILFKKGSDNLKFELSIENMIRTIKNYALISGLGLYGLSAVLFILALRKGELSTLYPIIATTYIWVNLLAARYLKERMNAYKWGGTALIILGVILTSVI